MSDNSKNNDILIELLVKNEVLVTFYYKLAAFFLLLVIISHIIFSALFLVYAPSKDIPQVLQFVAFNATVLIVEVFLSRMAFMLGSRSGQLRDLRFALLAVSKSIEPTEIETMARAIMSLRREAGALKVIDIESLIAELSKKKS
jgi:hypothetical protein